MTDVTAVVVGRQGECAPALDRAALLNVIRTPSLAGLVDAADEAKSALLWLIDSASVPADDALEPLLDAGAELAAGLPIDGSGRPIETLVGRFTESDVPTLLDAVRRRRVPLRHTCVVSLLARREALLAERPPDPNRFGRYAGTEWTARLFARTPGTLVPGSRVRAPAPKPGHPVHAIRMARTGVWARGETLRELQRSVIGR